jgi:predicted DNA-binding transcriptional regulator AlpA
LTAEHLFYTIPSSRLVKEKHMPTLIPVPDDGLLKMSEVLRLLNVSRTALFNLRRRGLIPSVHVGRALRFRPRDVERYVQGQTRMKLQVPPPSAATHRARP